MTGEGFHDRALIDKAKFLAGMETKAASAAVQKFRHLRRRMR